MAASPNQAPELTALELLRALRAGDADELRDELLFIFLPVVAYFVDHARATHPRLDADALAAVGLDALLGVLGSFDLDGSVSLEDFTWRRVGEAIANAVAASLR